MKAFQTEIDSLTKRSGASETMFLTLYKKVIEIPGEIHMYILWICEIEGEKSWHSPDNAGLCWRWIRITIFWTHFTMRIFASLKWSYSWRIIPDTFQFFHRFYMLFDVRNLLWLFVAHVNLPHSANVMDLSVKCKVIEFLPVKLFYRISGIFRLIKTYVY